MGKNGLRALGEVFARLQREGIKPHLLSLVDRRLATVDEKQMIKTIFGKVPEITREVTEIKNQLLVFISDFEYTPPIIVYDATPSSFHTSNLDLLARMQDAYRALDLKIYYLGEKPILTDPGDDEDDPPGDVKWAKESLPPDFRYFCELIELSNPVFLTCKEIITKRNLSVQEIWLWRAGSSSLKKLAGTDRNGVMGGAVEDKSLHDFSITLGILDPAQITGIKLMRTDGHDHLCLAKDALVNSSVGFLSRTNSRVEWNKVYTWHSDTFPADSMATADIRWFLQDGRSVLGKYLFSWVGTSSCRLEAEFRNKLKELGIQCPVGRIEETGRLEGLSCTYDLEEARIGLVKCSDQQDHEVWIVMNFLFKEAFEIRRYIKLINKTSGSEEDVPIKQPDKDADYTSLKSAEIAELVLTIVQCALGNISYETVPCGRKLTLLAHEAMLLIQRDLRNKIARMSEEELRLAYQRARTLVIDNKIRITSTSTKVIQQSPFKT